MKILPTVTVGIPAFNEGSHIGILLKEILRQRFTHGRLVRIIVYSDGSTDNTVAEAFSVHNRIIRVIKGKSRLGRGERQTQLMADCRSDIFILLDADIVLEREDCLDTLIAPIVAGRAELTSARIVPLQPRGWFERTLAVSMEMKSILFWQWKHGVNVYTCSGPARAFAKAFYRRLRFRRGEGEDMYTYLSSRLEGFRFRPVAQAVVRYRLPATFADHLKQSQRFKTSPHLLMAEFSQDILYRELTIPPGEYLKAAFHAWPLLVKKLPYCTLYVIVLCTCRVRSILHPDLEEMWQVGSSKEVHRTAEVLAVTL